MDANRQLWGNFVVSINFKNSVESFRYEGSDNRRIRLSSEHRYSVARSRSYHIPPAPYVHGQQQSTRRARRPFPLIPRRQRFKMASYSSVLHPSRVPVLPCGSDIRFSRAHAHHILSEEGPAAYIPGPRPSPIIPSHPLEVWVDDNILWMPSLPYSSASFFITNKASTIEWKGHGLKIHIPDNSLAPSLHPFIHTQLEVHTHTFMNDVKWYRDSMPMGYPGYMPVSALYSIEIGAGRLCKPVTIEFQHCLDISDTKHISDLVILRAADVTKYFEPIDNVVFDRRSGYGKVTVPKLNGNQEYDNFSWFIVALR